MKGVGKALEESRCGRESNACPGCLVGPGLSGGLTVRFAMRMEVQIDGVVRGWRGKGR